MQGNKTGGCLQEAQDLNIVGPQVDLVLEDMIMGALRGAKALTGAQTTQDLSGGPTSEHVDNSAIICSHALQQLASDAKKSAMDLALVRDPLQSSSQMWEVLPVTDGLGGISACMVAVGYGQVLQLPTEALA